MTRRLAAVVYAGLSLYLGWMSGRVESEDQSWTFAWPLLLGAGFFLGAAVRYSQHRSAAS